MRGRWKYTATVVLLLLFGLGGVAVLMMSITPGEVEVVETPPPLPPPPAPTLPMTPPPTPKAPPPAPPGPRKLPIAGSPGYHMVVNPDGSIHMVDPDGTKKLLAGPVKPVEAIEKKLKDVIDTPEPKKKGLGQLVVCDRGVIDIPTDVIVTFVGEDRVTTLNTDGTSTTYFVDGHSEHWSRDDKKSTRPSPKP